YTTAINLKLELSLAFMDIDTKINLIKAPPLEEVVTEAELKSVLETEARPKHYIGYEISGLLHIGSLLISGYKLNDFANAGIETTVYLADWHSFINKKLGGDWERIIKASEYFREAFKFFAPKAKIVLGSDLYHNNDEYWKDIMRFSSNITLSRAKRCVTIMGRSESESLDVAQYFYPPMQAVDVKYLGEDFPHGGMDQRKVHMLARDVFPKLGWRKPVALHHHLLAGLAKPGEVTSGDKLDRVVAAKMSKSKPWTAIFIHDSNEQIKDKLAKAWCPEKQAEMNPVLEIAKYIIFHERKEFTIDRESKYGGTVTFASYAELESEYIKGKIHPQDLKASVAEELGKIIDPIRKHFDSEPMRRLREIFADQ
ncbi:MAG: tyrosine--tRNA ligase, partial [Candidatus Micrarchaeaceae archaeon]